MAHPNQKPTFGKRGPTEVKEQISQYMANTFIEDEMDDEDANVFRRLHEIQKVI